MENGNGSVVVARDVTRRYGAGDTAVDALRGVSVDVPAGQLTAVMGPSGSGKSTLMHILAGLDKPTAGSVTVAGHEITTLGDSDLTKLRREHIGFVFQFFNLLPMLNAEENILLPLTIAGVKPDKAKLDTLIASVGLGDAPPPSPLGALRRPATARRYRACARLGAGRRLRRRADRQPGLEDGRRDPGVAPPCGAGHGADGGDGDARGPGRLDRRPGALPRGREHRPRAFGSAGCGRSRGRWKRSARSDQVLPEGHGGTEAPYRPHRARRRARRHDGQRHVRAHRLDRQGLRLDLLERLPGHRCHDHRQVGLRPLRRLGHDGAAVRRVAAGAGRCAPGRGCGDRRRRRRSAADRQGRQGNRLRRRAQSRLQRRPDPARLQHPHLGGGRMAGRGRGRDRCLDGVEEGPLGR